MRHLQYLVISVCALMGFSGYAQEQLELIQCDRTIGRSLTNCAVGQIITESDMAMDYTLIYDYSCSRILTPTWPVFSKDGEAHQGVFAVEEGLSRIVVIPETTKLTFKFTGTRSPIVASDCSLNIHSINAVPAASVISAWSERAQNLTDFLNLKSELFTAVTDLNSLVDLSVSRLRGMKAGVNTIFTKSLALAFADSEESEDDGGFPDFGFGDEEGTLPEDYGLSFDSWEEVDVYELGLIKFDDIERRFSIDLDRSRDTWYFDAREKLSVVGDLLAQLAKIENAIRIKEEVEEGGFQVPDPQDIRAEIEALVLEAKAFIGEVSIHADKIREQLEKLNKAIDENSV